MNRPPKPPTQETLAKYGLLAEQWLALAGVSCPICLRPWSEEVHPVTDHEHVRGWKKMPPDERRKYVRGVVCRGCNFFILSRSGTELKYANAARYIMLYNRRRDVEDSRGN